MHSPHVHRLGGCGERHPRLRHLRQGQARCDHGGPPQRLQRRPCLDAGPAKAWHQARQEPGEEASSGA
eukprot:15333565-Alexandrium_andersonii.AAC.1